MKSDRLVSIDVFRGFTVMLMTIVNNPGDWDHVYAPLLHAEWHGCTPTDLVFPFFLFIVGVSIVLADNQSQASSFSFSKIIARSLSIFCLGFFLSFFGKINFGDLGGLPLLFIRLIFTVIITILFLGDFKSKTKLIISISVFLILIILSFSGIEAFSNVRIPGVLQRIAVVYLVVSLLYFKLNYKILGLSFVSILLIYWYLMTQVEVPVFGSPNLEKGTNLAAWLDNFLLQGHLWASSKTWDPEGILSTLPAVSTGVFGVFIGVILTKVSKKAIVYKYLLIAGIAGTVLGLIWNITFPINKALWTSSYVLFAGGLATLFVAILYYFIEMKSLSTWVKPFVVFGVNPMVVFFFSGIIPRAFGMIKLNIGTENETNLQSYLYDNFISAFIPDQTLASFTGAIVYLIIWYFILRYFYNRNLIFKV